MNFFRGLMIAMPISIALWVLIALLIYLTLFQSSPVGSNELAAM
ncbi:hypothetical protein [Bradyrhizobium sp. CCGUVB1N3]|nr:hypothetical protein [Bradyrhizobium sp. CCGUVB1N3]